METKHTKGEWKVLPHTNYQKCIGTDKYIVAYTTIAIEQQDKTQAEANAKLIAAAPELLEALIYLTSRMRLDLLPESVSLKITNAINKATK